MAGSLRPAVFLDRDGTLNRLPPAGEYVSDPDALELLDGAAEAVGLLTGAGFAVVVVSNQRGIALGQMDQAQLDRVDARLRALLHEGGARLDASFYCPHGEASCSCRKPEPGLLVRAAADLGLALERSWMVGDSSTDVEAGRRAGCRTVQIEPRNGALLVAAREILAAHRDREVVAA